MIAANDHTHPSGLFDHNSNGALEHISASSMKRYFTCSLSYYFVKVAKLPMPTTPAMHLGKAVHEGLRYYNRARWLDEDTSLEAVQSLYRDKWSALALEQPVVFKDDEQEDKLRYHGKLILKAYLDHTAEAKQPKPKGVEVKLEAYSHSLPSPLVGIIDLVEPGNVPVDYKTVASTPNVEQEAWQHELQLVAYQCLLEENTGESVNGLELVFLVKTKTPKIIRHRMPPATDLQKARFLKIAEAFCDGVYHERFVPQTGMHCAWCPFKRECAQWQGGRYL